MSMRAFSFGWSSAQNLHLGRISLYALVNYVAREQTMQARQLGSESLQEVEGAVLNVQSLRSSLQPQGAKSLEAQPARCRVFTGWTRSVCMSVLFWSKGSSTKICESVNLAIRKISSWQFDQAGL